MCEKNLNPCFKNKAQTSMHWSFTSRDHAKGEAFSRCYCTTLCRGSNAQDAPPLSRGIIG